jgi:nitrate/nitrite transport system permease protein
MEATTTSPPGLRLRQHALRSAGAAEATGLGWLAALVRLGCGEAPLYQLRALGRQLGLPALAIGLVLLSWHLVATNITVGAMHLPTPGQVGERAQEQWAEWRAEGARHAAYERQIAATAAEQGLAVAQVRELMPYEQKRLFVDQLWLSIQTALAGVGLAVLVAVPIGILCGLSATINGMADPLIQLCKPVSPLAWFPVVYLFINKAMPGSAWMIDKSFLIAALVVALCAMWPALINAANGVANVERDHLNVARVLRLGFFTRIWRIILPASLPSICTGIRLSLGVGWMVLIAAEMMAVSPGLGGFIWDWYQSSNDIALSYLVLAVITVGAVGLLLDRAMVLLQKAATRGAPAHIR